MDVSSLLDGLNDKQREAVGAPLSNMLVLAGAGSGKTRVLTHRIAWLMQVEQQSPYSILAVTFTNKAAAEMRERVEKVVGTNMGRMWIGTFLGVISPWFSASVIANPLSRRQFTAKFPDYRF